MAILKDFTEKSGLETRESQEGMAVAVSDSIISKQPAFIEGGTGNGKTFSYLVPVINHLYRHPEQKAVISTATRLLQDQILHKDIPKVLDFFKAKHKDFAITEADVALMVGAQNHLCEEDAVFDMAGAVKSTSKGGFARKKDNNAQAGTKAELLRDLLGAKTFSDITRAAQNARKNKIPLMDRDLNALGLKVPKEAWKEMACNGTGINCRCFSAGKKTCAYSEAYKTALESRLVITNHHLLTANPMVSIDRQVIVMDEAHKLPEVLGRQHSGNINLTGVIKTCNAFLDATRQITYSSLEAEVMPAARAHVSDFLTVVSEIEQTVDNLSRQIQSPYVVMSGDDKEKFEKGGVKIIEQEQKHLTDSLTTLRAEITGIYSGKEAKKGVAVKHLKGLPAILRLSKEVEFVSNKMTKLLTGYNNTKFNKLHWFEKTRRNISMLAAPVDNRRVQGQEAGRIFSNKSAVFISATLDNSGRTLDAKTKSAAGAEAKEPRAFNHFKSEIGYGWMWGKATKSIDRIYPSNFDFKNQAKLIIPTDLPQPSFGKDMPGLKSDETTSYLTAVADSIASSAEKVHGNSLVLCTSAQQVEFLSERLREATALQGDKTEILNQLDGVTADRLVRHMRSGVQPKKILVGMQSLWQGIDLEGEALRGLFIVKTPFTTPNHPLEQERQKSWMKLYHKPYFIDASLPQALTTLKQGVGRLIRGADATKEYGVIVFYDPKLSLPPGEQKSYVKKIFDVFPQEMPVEFSRLENISARVEDFFTRAKERIALETLPEPKKEQELNPAFAPAA